MKTILIINGDPNPGSYNYALHDAFKRGVNVKGIYKIDELHVAELDFNLNLSKGYNNDIPIEPDLYTAQGKIRNADHIVWIYPLWWGVMPALLKRFIDRVFIPGFAFKYHTTSGKQEKLLKGKTTEIICTADYPILIFKLFFRSGGVKVMRKMVLDFCGLKTTKTTYLGPVIPSNARQRKNWLASIESLGRIKN